MPFPPPPRLACENSVHLWRFRTDQAAFARAPLTGLLSPDETARAARYRFETPRRNFMAGRIALRTILGAYLNRDPARLAFASNAHGKPALAHGAALRFNLSHSGQLGVLALTRRRPLGCDIEAHDRGLDIDAVATHFFSARERAWLARHDAGAARHAAFYVIWVRKEAYLKGLGTGLNRTPASFTVCATAGRLPPLPEADGLPWQAHRLALPPGYSGALAIGGSDAVLLHSHDWTVQSG